MNDAQASPAELRTQAELTAKLNVLIRREAAGRADRMPPPSRLS
ncbi:hypothetical protein ACFWY5_54915 [Nonomuraea sp. NPDC059007]